MHAHDLVQCPSHFDLIHFSGDQPPKLKVRGNLKISFSSANSEIRLLLTTNVDS